MLVGFALVGDMEGVEGGFGGGGPAEAGFVGVFLRVCWFVCWEEVRGFCAGLGVVDVVGINAVVVVVGERRGFVACGTGEFVGVFDCAFGDAGEESLFCCEFFFVGFVFVSSGFGFEFAVAVVAEGVVVSAGW